jgi:hypothetical protein
MAKKLKIWNGASWEDVTFAITPPNTAVTNSFTTNQVIDASTSVAALRVTQRGSGEAFRVEDETNPDSSPFIVNASGNVGVGTASLTSASGYGSITIDGTDGSLWSAKVAGTEVFRIQPTSIATTINQIANTPIVFNTNNTERVRISNTGNVNIGPLPGSGTSPLSINTNSFNSTVRMISLLNSRTYVGVDTGGVMIAGLANNGTVGVHDYGAIVFAARNGFADGGASTVSLFSGGSSSSRPNSHKFLESNSGSASVADVSLWTSGSARMSINDTGQIAILTAQTNGTANVRNIFTSTSAPTGGLDGDIWAVYTA